MVAYARRRGGRDPEAIGAETLTIAWRKLGDVPTDDARPWLYATARNLLRAERRRIRPGQLVEDFPQATVLEPEVGLLDPELARALSALSARDREALLLVAWEDLTPALAARSLGVTQAAFRVRLHRSRSRLRRLLESDATVSAVPQLKVEKP
ncbi:MAG TPA: sigma-70 family RNA polymerase sigma factor [Gaiellaceae bacterium]|nr:sigma-70 family RNA polymerase sigma factor [Gaiellaceae bacterium]